MAPKAATETSTSEIVNLSLSVGALSLTVGFTGSRSGISPEAVEPSVEPGVTRSKGHGNTAARSLHYERPTSVGAQARAAGESESPLVAADRGDELPSRTAPGRASWAARIAAAKAAGGAARSRLSGSTDAECWQRFPVAEGCGRNTIFVVLAGCIEAPCWVGSSRALDDLIARAVRSTYHGWETPEEGIAYARSAGFYNVSEWRA